jgi:hypothetical protein
MKAEDGLYRPHFFLFSMLAAFIPRGLRKEGLWHCSRETDRDVTETSVTSRNVSLYPHRVSSRLTLASAHVKRMTSAPAKIGGAYM